MPGYIKKVTGCMDGLSSDERSIYNCVVFKDLLNNEKVVNLHPSANVRDVQKFLHEIKFGFSPRRDNADNSAYVAFQKESYDPSDVSIVYSGSLCGPKESVSIFDAATTVYVFARSRLTYEDFQYQHSWDSRSALVRMRDSRRVTGDMMGGRGAGGGAGAKAENVQDASRSDAPSL